MSAFVRVVHFGLLLSSEDADILHREGNGTCEIGGRTAALNSRYEAKVGGGGHVVFTEVGAQKPLARLIAEPDGSMVQLVAVTVPNEDGRKDDVVVSDTCSWLKRLFGLQHDAASGGPLTCPLNRTG